METCESEYIYMGDEAINNQFIEDCKNTFQSVVKKRNLPCYTTPTIDYLGTQLQAKEFGVMLLNMQNEITESWRETLSLLLNMVESMDIVAWRVEPEISYSIPHNRVSFYMRYFPQPIIHCMGKALEE